METTVTNTPTVEVSKSITVGRFSGMLGQFQVNAYNTCVACGLSKQVSHKIAGDYGSDIGRMMRHSDDLSSRVAKANKDKESKLSIKGSARISLSDSMEVVRVCQQIHELHKEGLLGTKDLPQLAVHLREYVAASESWVATQTWA